MNENIELTSLVGLHKLSAVGFREEGETSEMKTDKLMNLVVDNPNFSIVLPGDCNASCKFCFWKETPKADTLSLRAYRARLDEVLQELPNDFRQCSITGGEPTKSVYLNHTLASVRERFDKVVLSTNGYDVNPLMLGYIDHLNVSRHEMDDHLNTGIFQSNDVPNVSELREICDMANSVDVDVTLNCVLDSKFSDKPWIRAYIQFAKFVNANAVCFRKVHSDLKPLPVESGWGKIVAESSCPVCASRTMYIEGMKITWKYSVKEPSIEMKGIYEAVFHSDGRLTNDWAGNNEITWSSKIIIPEKSINKRLINCNGTAFLGFDCGSSHKSARVIRGERSCDVPKTASTACGGGKNNRVKNIPETHSCGGSSCGSSGGSRCGSSGCH